MDKVQELKILATDIKACKRCALCHTRNQPAISRGDPRSPLMIVSDMPREADDKAGEILCGKAGKKIDGLLEDAGLKPEQVYFTSIIKCWPGRRSYFPEDESPAKCFGFLMKQFEIIKPMVVVLVGPEALAWTLLRGLGEKPDPIEPWVGPMYRRREVYDDLRFMVIKHPLELIRAKHEPSEEKCIEVLKTAKEYIVAHQNGRMTPHIAPVDLKKQVIHSRKEQIEPFKVKVPSPESPPPEQPKT